MTFENLQSAALPLAAFLAAFTIIGAALFLARKLSNWLDKRNKGKQQSRINRMDIDQDLKQFNEEKPENNK